jgi:hypothetical protein
MVCRHPQTVNYLHHQHFNLSLVSPDGAVDDALQGLVKTPVIDDAEIQFLLRNR